MPANTTDGSYRTLASFQMATLIYDRTVAFCECFIDARSRLVDQMVQAARSGRQNIAEGSRTGLVNPTSGRRLTAVARASLEELLLDYEDFLRQRTLPQWERSQQECLQLLKVWSERMNDPEALTAASQRQWRRLDEIHASWYAKWFQEKVPAATQANALICLIHQANYRLDRMLQGKVEGQSSLNTDQICPACGSPMVVRTIRSGDRKGERFLGCKRYPDCRATAPIRA